MVDLPVELAAMLREFVGARHSGLVFCEEDGLQISQRDILKYSLHPMLKKLRLEQGGLNIFRRFRITAMETAEVPQRHHRANIIVNTYPSSMDVEKIKIDWIARAFLLAAPDARGRST